MTAVVVEDAFTRGEDAVEAELLLLCVGPRVDRGGVDRRDFSMDVLRGDEGDTSTDAP